MKKRLTEILLPGLTKDNIWKLFLFCIFLFHLWTFFMVFRDVPWVVDRFGDWDAVGLASYALMFALVESAAIFVFLIIVNFFIPNRFEHNQRLSILSVMVLVIWFWGVLGQIYFMNSAGVLRLFQTLVSNASRPLAMIYIMVIPFVAVSIFLPLYSLVKKPQRALKFTEIIDRISTLSILYLVFDVVGIFIVIYRNII